MRIRILAAVVFTVVVSLLSGTRAFGSPNGITGRTLKSTTAGCGSCHGSSATAGLAVGINGPDMVTAGQTASYTVSVAGSNGPGGGVDIAVRNGTLSPVSPFLQLSNGELTHTAAQTVPTTYAFTYTAPANAGTDTLYATGKGSGFTVWNAAPNKVVSVIASGPAPPPAPTLAAPANGAPNQPTTLTLSWNASTGATSYRLQVSTSQTFGSTVFDDSTLTGTSRQVGPLSNGTTYYWHTRAKNGGGTSAYSTVWNFTTVSAAPVPPPTPVLASPANGSTGQPTTLTLGWNSSAGATSYRLQVSADQSFASTVFDDSTLTGTSKQVGPLLIATTYFWHVRAKNGAGTSAYSSAWSFATNPSPPPGLTSPTLVSPRSGMTGLPTTILFVWNSSHGATQYHIQVALDSLFRRTTVNDSSVADTSKRIGPLQTNTRYFWRVRAENSTTMSAYSTAWNLTTSRTRPCTPELESPGDDDRVIGTTLVLSWRRCRIRDSGEGSDTDSEADSYIVQIALDSLFASKAIADSAVRDTILQVNGLASDVTYYWRVQGVNDAGISDWSALRKFRTSTLSSVNDPGNIPDHFALEQNYPNPFNPSTKISYSLPSDTKVTLKVFDLLGDEVATIVDEWQQAGRYEVSFDARHLSSGVYFYQLRAGALVQTRRLVLIR